MTLNLIAADIASRIPDMAKDSIVNNEQAILNLLLERKCFYIPQTHSLVTNETVMEIGCGKNYWTKFRDEKFCKFCGGKIEIKK